MPMRLRSATGSTSGRRGPRRRSGHRRSPSARRDQVVHPVEAAQERALAASRRADERRDEVAGDVDVDVLQRQGEPYWTEPSRMPKTTSRFSSGGSAGDAESACCAPTRIGAAVASMRGSPLPLEPVPDHDRRGVHRQQYAEEHDDRGGGERLELLLRLADPWKIWTGRAVKAPSGVGSNATYVSAPISTSGAVSPIARDRARIDPVTMPGSAAGSTDAERDLPAGRAEGEAALADRVGHGPQRLARRDDHRGSTSSARIIAPASSTRAEAEAADEEREPEDAVDDRRDPGQVRDVHLEEPVVPAVLLGELLQPDARSRCRPARPWRTPGRAARPSRGWRGARPALSGFDDGGLKNSTSVHVPDAVDEHPYQQRCRARRRRPRPRSTGSSRNAVSSHVLGRHS